MDKEETSQEVALGLTFWSIRASEVSGGVILLVHLFMKLTGACESGL